MDSIKMIRVKSFVLTGTVVLKRYLSRASSLVERAGCIGLDFGFADISIQVLRPLTMC